MSATAEQTTTVITMPRHQCPCPNCSEARNVRHQATRYLTTEQIKAHLIGKWTDAEIAEYMRRLAGEGRIQEGDCVIVKEADGQLDAGAYAGVAEVDEEGGRARLFNVWPCGDPSCWGERHRQHERVDHGWTGLDNLELVMPPPEPEPPAGTASGRIRARRITLIRAEAESHDTAIFAMPNPPAMWEAADDQLREWARSTGPSLFDAETVLFKIEFEDGKLYEGEFFIFHPDSGSDRGFTLADHVRDFCASFGGLQIPEGQGEFIYDNISKNSPRSDESRARFIAEYELGREVEPTIWTAPDGYGGRCYYTRNGSRRVQEWFQSARADSRGRWRCRVAPSLPPDARETADVPSDVRTAVRTIFPQLRAA